MEDAAQRGRIARGFMLPHTVLSDQDKQNIVKDRRLHKVIAADYGVCTPYISTLKRRAGITTIRPLETYRRGSEHHLALFNKKQIAKIRKLWATGKYFQREIADLFNTDQRIISRIVRGDSYA